MQGHVWLVFVCTCLLNVNVSNVVALRCMQLDYFLRAYYKTYSAEVATIQHLQGNNPFAFRYNVLLLPYLWNQILVSGAIAFDKILVWTCCKRFFKFFETDLSNKNRFRTYFDKEYMTSQKHCTFIYSRPYAQNTKIVK